MPSDRAARVGVPHATEGHCWRACHDYGQRVILIGEAYDALAFIVYSARFLLIDCSNIVQGKFSAWRAYQKFVAGLLTKAYEKVEQTDRSAAAHMIGVGFLICYGFDQHFKILQVIRMF